jgi:hypothetical protein
MKGSLIRSIIFTNQNNFEFYRYINNKYNERIIIQYINFFYNFKEMQ